MIEEIKEVLQSFLAPQLEGIRGDIRGFRRELLSEIHRVSKRFRPTFCGSSRKSIFRSAQ
ncbi:MAG: hypothetical protein DMG17_03385 [Acidobacteria bacterium]|nr:MAG: hypothetical protein DMG17_03385 [Acidobacteriota bacterium]